MAEWNNFLESAKSCYSKNFYPARLGVKIEKLSDFDKNFRVYVDFDVGFES